MISGDFDLFNTEPELHEVLKTYDGKILHVILQKVLKK